jgi:hypothetical protein
MAGFENGRRGPNVSQYIANLNAIPAPHDVVNQHDGTYNLEDDLAVFTNAEFFDFDLGEEIDPRPIQYDPSQELRARRENAAAHKAGTKALDFGHNQGEWGPCGSETRRWSQGMKSWADSGKDGWTFHVLWLREDGGFTPPRMRS